MPAGLFTIQATQTKMGTPVWKWDAHPCIPQVCTEASLPPAAGTACAAALRFASNEHHPLGSDKKRQQRSYA